MATPCATSAVCGHDAVNINQVCSMIREVTP